MAVSESSVTFRYEELGQDLVLVDSNFAPEGWYGMSMRDPEDNGFAGLPLWYINARCSEEGHELCRTVRIGDIGGRVRTCVCGKVAARP